MSFRDIIIKYIITNIKKLKDNTLDNVLNDSLVFLFDILDR